MMTRRSCPEHSFLGGPGRLLELGPDLDDEGAESARTSPDFSDHRFAVGFHDASGPRVSGFLVGGVFPGRIDSTC